MTFTLDLTPQEAYDQIKDHFSQPGAKLSKNKSTGNCYYRSPIVGNKCVVGCLIPDEHYTPLMENCNADKLHYLGFHIQDAVLQSFLIKSQATHDGSSTVRNFLKSLDLVAQDFSLKIS